MVFQTYYNDAIPITKIRHPAYEVSVQEWLKWRLIEQGGIQFVRRYLKKFSARESEIDFSNRIDMTYNPSFAKAAVHEIKNAIFQRTFDVVRTGGPQTYQEAILGKNLGVDLRMHNMNSFVGLQVLPELLTMSRIGVFVDMPSNVGYTIKDKGNKHPYFYTYATEDILSWEYDLPEHPTEFKRLLLCDHVWERDAITKLPLKQTERYRLVWIDDLDGLVHMKFFNTNDEQIDPSTDQVDSTEIILDLEAIPFVSFEIPVSLYKDVADYQIALMNMESSDINFILRANFPFYTEQVDPKNDVDYLKAMGDQGNRGNTEQTDTAKPKETKIGITQGRRYNKSLERPGFIHPSSEPLIASMTKGGNIKQDIRALINLAVIDIGAQGVASGNVESSQNSLETGLSYIGLVLETGEKKLAEYWSRYESKVANPASVFYPRTYSIKTDADRQAEAQSIQEMSDKVASATYRKEMSKRLAYTLLAGKISNDTLEQINEEVDAAKILTVDAQSIVLDLQNGLCTVEVASEARGYPEGEAAKAKVQHAERLATIAAAQGPHGSSGQLPKANARGVPDLATDPVGGDTEKIGQPGRGPSNGGIEQ